MIQGVKQEDLEDFLKEITFELVYNGWIGMSKANKGRMSIACRGTKTFTEWTLKNQESESRQVDRMERVRVEGAVLTFWMGSTRKCITFSAFCCFPFCTDIYRYIISVSVYIFLHLCLHITLLSLLEWV